MILNNTKEIVSSLLSLGIVGPSLAINNSCNLKCGHCYIYQGNDFRKKDKDFTLERALDIVRDLKGTTPFISIAAMEPLLTPISRKICIEIGREIKSWREEGIETQFGIISNLIEAPKMTDEEVRQLNESLRYIAFSLEHGNPEQNDRIRGEGCFKRTTKGVYSLINRGFDPKKLILEGTIVQQGLNSGEQVRSLLHLGDQLGIGKVSVNPYIPSPIEVNGQPLTEQDYFSVYDDILKTLEETDREISPLEFTAYATYETPIAVNALRLIASERGLTSSDFKVNTFDASYYAKIPNLINIDGRISLAMWPMEEIIAPRIVAAQNKNRINIIGNSAKYDSGTEITYCFGLQRDSLPVGYWIPGLYQELDRVFRTNSKDLVARLSTPTESEEITFDIDVPRTREEYITTVAETAVRKTMQKIERVRRFY
ncbi:radical SAM protein [Candidatus Woesearchaeota archaeon]|nr:radical SAM protein [Candidatus Woesearchaeota archaeon]